MEPQQETDQETQDLQQRIGQQRVQHIVDSYLLASSEPGVFRAYLHDLLSQYPHGLIELALVDTLTKNWLTIPMQKGIPFLTTAHEQIKRWQANPSDLKNIGLTPSQFHQITGLNPNAAFIALEQFQPEPAPTATPTATE